MKQWFWSASDEDILRKRWGDDVNEIAAELGRTPGAVQERARLIGLVTVRYRGRTRTP